MYLSTDTFMKEVSIVRFLTASNCVQFVTWTLGCQYGGRLPDCRFDEETSRVELFDSIQRVTFPFRDADRKRLDSVSSRTLTDDVNVSSGDLLGEIKYRKIVNTK